MHIGQAQNHVQNCWPTEVDLDLAHVELCAETKVEHVCVLMCYVSWNVISWRIDRTRRGLYFFLENSRALIHPLTEAGLNGETNFTHNLCPLEGGSEVGHLKLAPSNILPERLSAHDTLMTPLKRHSNIEYPLWLTFRYMA